MHTRISVLVAGIALLAGACSFDVENPGPVADENLENGIAADARRGSNDVENAVFVDVGKDEGSPPEPFRRQP